MTHPEATRSGADTGGTISSVLGGLVTRTHFGRDSNAGRRWAFVVVAALAVISAVTSALAARDSKAKTSAAFLFLNGMALSLLPATSRLLERLNPK